jgi:rubrerythrin
MGLLEEFGPDWFEWEPETLKSEILTSFKASSVSEHNWQKIQAVRALTRTVGFWEEWHIFEKIVQALNNNVPRFDIAQRCTMAQLMAGVSIANTVRKEIYGDEIRRYISACAIDEGVTYLPEPLSFAQEVLSEPRYRCTVCGTDALDDNEGRCDFCSARFQDGKPLNFKPSEHVPDDAGTKVTRYLKRDPARVEAKFKELKLKDRHEMDLDDESAVDVQVAKLVVAYDYMRLREKQMVQQLEELRSWMAKR